MLARAAAALAVAALGCGRLGFGDDAPAGGDAPTATDAAPAADALPAELLAGCVLYQHMDEAAWTGATGEVLDACGGDDNGAATGGATTIAGGVRGRAGLFVGGTSCVRIPDRAAQQAATGLTMSAWIYPTALDGVDEFGIVSKRVDYTVEGAYSMFLWTGSQLWVDLETEDDRFAATPVFVNDQWRQITVVYDGDAATAQRVAVYLDGALVEHHAETATAITNHAADLWVGCLPLTGPNQSFVGRLDEVAVWTRALAPAEVAAWYQATAP